MLRRSMAIFGLASGLLSRRPLLSTAWLSTHAQTHLRIGRNIWGKQPAARTICQAVRLPSSSLGQGLGRNRLWLSSSVGSRSRHVIAAAEACRAESEDAEDSASVRSLEALEPQTDTHSKEAEIDDTGKETNDTGDPASSARLDAKTHDPWAPLEGPSTSERTQWAQPRTGLDQPRVQTCDFTTLAACAAELQRDWVPAKVDQVLQSDPHTVCLHLRNGKSQEDGSPGVGRGWLYISWHQTHARVCIGPAPDRGSAAEAFAFGEQLHRELRDKVLCSVSLPRDWERVVQFDFGPSLRLQDSTHRLYAEVMGNFSNLILTDTALPAPAAAADSPPKKKAKKRAKAAAAPDATPAADATPAGQGTASHADPAGDDGISHDRPNRITACARQVGAQQSRVRQIQVGGTFRLPPQARKLQPTASEGKAIWKGNLMAASTEAQATNPNHAHIARVLLGSYAGMGPHLAWQLCSLAGVDGRRLPQELHAAQWDALFAQWQAWLRAVTEGASFRATMDAEKQRYSVLGAHPEEEPAGVLAMIDTYYRQPQKEVGSGRQLHKVASAVDKAIARLASKREMLEAQLQQAGKAEHTQKQADLLMANLYLCERGAESVTVEDWETGEPIKIRLNPARDPREVGQDLYKLARKQRRTAGSVEPLLEELQGEEEFLQEVQSQVQMLQPDDQEDLRALQDIQDELVDRGYMKPPQDAAMAARGAAKGRRANKRNSDAGSSPFRQFTSPSGFQVLIGRNNRQNDDLTHKVAQPSDLWFHSRGVPGAHTVLRIPSGRKESQDDVRFAADLSAFFSKARAEGKADVVVTEVSNLRKPKGAHPGQVLVMHERVVVAQPGNSAAALTAVVP